MNKKLFSSVIRGVGYATIAAVVSRLFAFTAKLVLAHLGPQTFGLFSLTTEAFQSLVFLATLGIPYGVMRFLAISGGRKKNASLFLLSGSVLVFISSLLASVMLFVFAPTNELRLISLFLPAAGLLLVFKHALLGLLRFAHAFLLDVVESGVRVFLYVLAALLGLGVSGAVFGYGAASFIAAGAGIALLAPLVRGGAINPTYALTITSFAWPVALSQVVTGIIEAGSLFVLINFWGSDSVGLYSVALTFGTLLFVLPQIIIPVFTPAAARALGHKGEAMLVYQKTLRWLLGMCLPVFLFLFILYVPLVRLLFGEPYAISQHVGRLLLAACFVYAVLVWFPRQVLDMAGHTKQTLLLTLLRAGLLVASWALLVPRFAGAGLALGVGVSWLAEGIGAMMLVRRLLWKR